MEKWIYCSLMTKSLREVDRGTTTWMRWRRKRRRRWTRWWLQSQSKLEVLDLKEEEEEEVKSLYAGKDTFFDSCL